MTSPVPPSPVRKLWEDRFAQFMSEVDSAVEAEVSLRVDARLQAQVDAAVREASERNRQALAAELGQSLNQSIRRLRQAADVAQVASVLTESAARFCRGAAFFRLQDARVRCEFVSDADADNVRRNIDSVAAPLGEMPAFENAADTREPVIAMATETEVSPAVVQLARHRPSDRAVIFPLVVRGETRAFVYTWGDAQMGPLELLCQVASLVLENLTPSLMVGPGLVEIAPPQRTDRMAVPWSKLSLEEQHLHLAAQRFARVQVAEIRLYRHDAVRAGRASRNLYLVLQDAIDPARDEFRRNFVAISSTMIDYLHLEILRTLANDDAALLGQEYPGPLV